MYHVCQSVHARDGIHTTTTLSLRVSSIQNLAYRIRKRCVVSCVASTQQACFPTGAGEICTSNLAQGQVAARVPDKPRQAPNRGRRGPLNVHLQASLLSNQVARCLMGQAIDQTV